MKRFNEDFEGSMSEIEDETSQAGIAAPVKVNQAVPSIVEAPHQADGPKNEAGVSVARLARLHTTLDEAGGYESAQNFKKALEIYIEMLDEAELLKDQESHDRCIVKIGELHEKIRNTGG